MKRLKGGMPRRFKDHRRREARPYREAYAAIAGRYQPQDRLASRLVGVAADLLLDYDALSSLARPTPRTRSARRKTVGLILGMLREVSSQRNGHARDQELDLARQIQQAQAAEAQAEHR